MFNIFTKKNNPRKPRKIINQSNSYMAVQCNAKEKCEMRHTQLCQSCKHNCGRYEEKNCFERR